MILALQQSADPLTLLQLMQRTGFKSTQPFRVSLRYLVGTGDLQEGLNVDGEAVYSCSPVHPPVHNVHKTGQNVHQSLHGVQKTVVNASKTKVRPGRRQAVAC